MRKLRLMIRKYLDHSVVFWLAAKLLLSRRSLFGGSAPLALLGLSVGVGTLVFAMAVFSGFETTLKSSVADISGHIQVIKRSRSNDNWIELTQRLKSLDGAIESAVRFVFIEAVTAKKGQIFGVLLQGVDQEHVQSVLNFEPRLVRGSASLGIGNSGAPLALVGKRLAQKMDLQLGEKFKIVVPLGHSLDDSRFDRKVGEFEFAGALDLGKYEWNERVIITDLEATQNLAEIGNRYTGLLLKVNDIDSAREISFGLSQKLGAPYWVRDWRESNENLFDAVIYEKRVIFFVVLVIVIVAAFNISSTLSVNVMQRYPDIAILKTLGMSPRRLQWVFTVQGAILGSAGFIMGTLIGWLLCQLFILIQKYFELMSGAVYKVDGVAPDIRFADLIAVFIATVGICFVSSLAPARKGAHMQPVEGIRHG
ncbi:MAG: FtsX-like permease family protein [Bdellovibrionia bacterium]